MNVIYVESPFQMLQVNDYLKAFNVENYYLIARLNGLDENNRQIKAVAALMELRVDSYFLINNKLKLTLLALFMFSVSFFSKSVVLGDDNSGLFRIIRRFISINKLVFLDDGVATLKSNLPATYNRFFYF